MALPATFSQFFYNKSVHTQVVRNYYCARGNLRVPGFLYAIVVQLVERLPSKQDVLRVRVPSIAPRSMKYATLVERVQEEKASGADAYDGALCKGGLISLEVYRKLGRSRFIGGRAWLRFVEQPKQQQAVHCSAAFFFL